MIINEIKIVYTVVNIQFLTFTLYNFGIKGGNQAYNCDRNFN